MPSFIAGLVVLYLLLLGVKQFSRLSPTVAARLVRQGGGVIGLIGALLLLLRGSVTLASLLASLAIGFAGWRGALNLAAMFRGAAGGQPRISKARSAMIEMQLNLDNGKMSGWVLGGPMQGQALDMLARPACLELYATCLRDDPDGARLLETYLDRRFAGWREAAQGQSDAGRASANAGLMTEKDAYEVLGLEQGANAEDITRAHRALMKKLHPDHGGATSLAARVNQAKDTLLRRH
jgi:DnaJ-like protein